VNRDLDGLRYELAQNSKYKFIIEGVERGSRNASLLEIGCSRGYLTSYFILAGYNIIGVDVSESALAFARAAFGDYFAMRGDSVVTDRAPYDVIYHVGTIGCVSDPLGLTRQLLSMLKPGGRLLFNSPNLQSCWLTNQLWIDAAPPPDLVAIFPPGFWARCFADQAYVEEQIEHCDPNKGLSIGLRKLFGRKWKCPLPIPLDKSSELYLKGSNGTALNGHRPRIGDEAWRFFERAVLKVCRDTGLLRHVRKEPSEFGLFVSMTR
jgi:SAM-dependent methyltransferase